MTVKVLNVLMDRTIGGPQLRVLQVASRLRLEGFETIVAIPEGEGGIAPLLKQQEIRFHEIRHMNRVRQTLNPWPNLRWALTYWLGVFYLIRIIRREGIHIVHQNTIESTQGAVAGRLAGVRVVWHVNGVPHPLISRVFRRLIPLLAHAVAVPSHEFASEFFGDSPPRVSGGINVLYPPVDVRRFQGQPNGSFREQLGIPSDSLLVGTIGNINPLKGHGDFIRAAGIVGKEIPDSHFVVVGAKLATRKKYFDHLQQEVHRLGLGDRFHFAGFQEDIPAVLASLDIYVHSSHTEGLPMAVEEAMAAAKPIVATAVGGVKELLPDSSYGLAVEPHRPEAIAEGILRLSKDPTEARSMGIKAAGLVAGKFSLAETVRHHKELYEREASRLKARSPVNV